LHVVGFVLLWLALWKQEAFRGGEDLAMQDVMFETLSQILAIESEICQGSALHGLSHLHHPKTGVVIERYLSSRPSLPREWKDAALAAARFQLM